MRQLNIIKNKLCSNENDEIRLRFPVCTYSNLFAFKRFSRSTGYTHLNALIRLVDTTLHRTKQKTSTQSVFLWTIEKEMSASIRASRGLWRMVLRNRLIKEHEDLLCKLNIGCLILFCRKFSNVSPACKN